MKKWYSKGLQFECQGSGKCCSSRGEYGYVYLTQSDIKNMSKHLNLTETHFLSVHCMYDEDSQYYYLKQGEHPDCVFLYKNKCSVYQARPTQCKTWPFWPETLNAKTWKKEVESFCPGINKGKVFTAQEIDEIVNEQVMSEY